MEKNLNFRERILGNWGRWASVHWGRALLIGLLITVVMTLGVSRLKMEMTFFSIMPGSSQQVQDLKRVMKEFPAASGITVVIDARDIDDGAEAERLIKETVDDLVAELEKDEYSKYVKEVMGSFDRAYFQNHGFILTDEDDLERMGELYADLNLAPFLNSLNNDLEREYSGNDDNLEDDQDAAVAQFRGLGQLFDLLDRTARGEDSAGEEVSAVLDDFLLGDAYMLSRDNRMGLVSVQPTFVMEDLPMLVPGVNLIEETAKSIASEHGLTAGCTGLTTIGRDEMVTSEQGLAASMLIALILIMVLMIFTFRMVSTPLITGIPLLLGIYWAMGMTGFVIHRLNIMTAMYMIALIGLGIDFAIHLLTTFIQERDGGNEFHDAMALSFTKTGTGILTGALTTAIAFFALQFAETEMMRELGMVAGLGIIFELAAMLIFIPALMGFRHHRKQKKGRPETRLFKKVKIRSDMAGGLGKVIDRSPLILSLSLLLFVGLLATQIGKLSIEDNLLEMEARGLESVELQDTIVEEFQMGADGLFVLSGDLEEVKRLEDELEDLDSVKQVDSIGPFLVTAEEYEERKGLVTTLREDLATREASGEIDSWYLADELIRLQMNLLELSDMAYLGNMQKMLHTLNDVTGWNDEGDKVNETSLDRLIEAAEGEDPEVMGRLIKLQDVLVPLLRAKLTAMANPAMVGTDDLPSLYKNTYISDETGEFLVTVIPTRNPWEGEFRDIYTTQIDSVTSRASGMILAADQMTVMAESDGVRAAIAALVAIFLVLLFDFRNIKLVLLTMLPLGCSFLALFGFMGLTGIKFDFINIISVPLLIGIGVDDSVHISHRYIIEGKGKLSEVVAKTGTAVMLTSITTIIAFASFIPSIMRAMRSTGIVLSIAMAFAFAFAIVLYPSLLRLLVDENKAKLTPWNRK